MIDDRTLKFDDFASDYAKAYVESLDSDKDRRNVIVTDMALEDSFEAGFCYYWYGYVDGGIGEESRFAWSVCNEVAGERSPSVVTIPFGLYIE